MTKNQKQILNKLLKHLHNNIIIDKVLVQSKNKFESKKLITKSNDIKREVEKYFKEQFKLIDQECVNIYEKQEKINKDWYTEVMNRITEEE